MKAWKVTAASFALSVAAIGSIAVIGASGHGHTRTEMTGLESAAGSISVGHPATLAQPHACTRLAVPKAHRRLIGQTAATSIYGVFQHWLYLGMVQLERHMDPAVMHVLVALTGQPPLVSTHHENLPG